MRDRQESRETQCFLIVLCSDRRVGSVKRVQRSLAKALRKICAPLRLQAHLQVKILKTDLGEALVEVIEFIDVPKVHETMA